MNGVPDVEGDELSEEDEDDDQLSPGEIGSEMVHNKNRKMTKRRVLCTPYIQIFKNGKRVF
jgi:hypothetical protein